MSNKRPMNKWLLYIIFVAKFLAGIGLIIWTVYMTIQSDVGDDNDNAFLSTYHTIDDNYNSMIISNVKLNKQYNIIFKLNNEIINGLSHDDIFLSQRVINKRKIRKDILNIGSNIFEVIVTDKSGIAISNIDIKMLVTMATNHKYDKNLEFKNNTSEKFDITRAGYWNITGTVKINNVEGYFFIKTNAK